jgi:hypothetical protein
MSDGFLGRWARRKEAVRKGEEVLPEPVQPVAMPVAVAPAVAPVPVPVPATAAPAAEAPPPPTLEDVQSLTPASDFSRFVRPDVSPEVKNAAMKKLFADPHFNVMDRLDTYIDDYGKPDPIPPEMLRQLASAKFLKLFDEEEEKPQPGEDAGKSQAQAVAQSDVCSNLPSQPPAPEPAASKPDDADPDLRLQQDDAPGPRGPGAGSS